MEFQELKYLNQIIERESKDSTYKFALLRAVIDLSQEYTHFRILKNDMVSFPLGLLIEKWLIYYYPIFNSSKFIPQKHGESEKQEKGKVIPFRKLFNEIINYYHNKGGINVFYNDLKNKGIPKEISKVFLELSKMIGSKIVDMPMKHLGQSINKEHYYIFSYNNDYRNNQTDNLDIGFLIKTFGTFNIKKNFYDIFEFLGGFLTGSSSILIKWADFSANIIQDQELDRNFILEKIIETPVTERDIKIAKKFYDELINKNKNKLICIWSGKEIQNFDIDHLIPFSIWKNNNLWNLLPTNRIYNSRKRDKIPSLIQLEKSKDRIIHYWELMVGKHKESFFKEVTYSLLGENINEDNWKNDSFNALKEKCNYLINYRRYDEWKV
jgi:hypothetical protein